MVATTQSDPYSALSHKIGWSVGLEYTFDRVRRLVEIYAEQGDLTYGMWSELVTKEWGLKNFHITDFFGSIDLISASGRTLYVQPTLDVLSILWRALPAEKRDDALRLVLAVRFVLDDGDIFLNCLASEFDPDATRSSLIAMGTYKIAALKRVFPSSAVQAKIFKLVKVDTQPTNKGSKGKAGETLASRRLEELSHRTGSLSAVPSEEITVSDDYLRKVLGRRRDWATSLGLATDKGKLTGKGRRFLDVLTDAGFCTSGEAFAVWPLHHQFRRLAIKPERIDAPDLNMWSFLAVVYSAMGGAADPRIDEASLERIIEFLARCYQTYRLTNKGMAVLKNELPTYVAYLTYLAHCYSNNEGALDVPALIETDRNSPEQRVLLRLSQYSDGSFTIRKKNASVFLS
ncbi:hypothetical protein LZ519_06655 [Sphingomonas sp. RG327]|uniref:Uncharacterized protein n=1 Tax=Sphingomonas anseongensis TaxID=2908207 RepID=A0ABT0RFH9_9SPHN|nr:hypothetical protein [Sphingomonas anseongensis]MCL6678996.1 hypothetical protein [Sphingomonas anseongensis]